MAAFPDFPIPLSYSAINDYLICPKRFYHNYLAKDIPKETKSFQQTSGTLAHEALKKRIKIKEPLPAEFQHWEPMCQEIDAHPAPKYSELQLGIDENGSPCDFFAPQVKLRGAIDLALVEQACMLLDYKTGKPREDPLELYIQGLLIAARFPEVQKVSGAYVWLRENRMGPVYEVHLAPAWAKVTNIVKSMAARVPLLNWPADDGPLCAWCPVPKPPSSGTTGALFPACIHRKDPP